MAQRLIVDREQIKAYATTVFLHASDGVTVSLRTFDEGADKALSILPVRLNGIGLTNLVEAAVQQAQFAADHGKKAVFCPPIAGFATNTAKETDLIEAYTLSVECDDKPGAARRRLEALLGPATLIVASGGTFTDPATGEIEAKLHLHWRLSEAATDGDLALLKQARRLATIIAGGDRSNIPVTHPMRWPGSWHRKGEPRLATIVERRPAEIDLRTALERLEAAQPDPTEPKENGGSHERKDGDERSDAVLIANITSGAEFHDSLVPLGARMLSRGMAGGAVVNFLRGLMEEIPPIRRDARWQTRWDAVPRCVSSAEAKWGRKEQPRRAAPRNSDYGADPFPDDRQTEEQADAAGPAAKDALDIWANPTVPPFPFETLPDPLATYAQIMARISGCDPAACAWSAIMSVQAVLDHRIRVRATHHGNYLVGPNLWVAQIGDVSSRKSHPVGQAVDRTKPLDRRDRVTFQAMLNGIADEKERAKVEREEGPRRRVVYDTTSEKLCDLVAKQNEGVTIVRDELSGWLGAMDKYGGGKGGAQDRSIYLAGFDGRSYAQDRMKGSRHIDNLSVGIYGGIQMAALRKQGDLDHDGLLQRFIPMLLRPAVPYEDVEGYEQAERDFEAILTRLDTIRARVLCFSHEAQAIYRAVDTDALDLMQAGVVVSEAFRGWIGKTPKRFAALCLILHCVDAVITSKDRDALISEETARKAQTIVNDFILPHGFRFYDDYAGGSGKGLVVAVADCILRWSTVNVPITLRQIARNTNAMKNPDLTLRDRLEVIDYFVAAGWLVPVEPHFMNRAWWVVPGLAERFARERRARSEWLAAIQARFPTQEI